MKTTYLIFAFFFVVSAECQTRNWYMAAKHTSSQEYLLDQIQTAPIAAFSLRKLRAAYTGSAIRVIRLSDNSEADIGFDAFGNLNTSQLLSFCGGSIGEVTTWYDQSGNGNNVTQTIASSRFAVCSGGAAYIINGRPYVSSNTDDWMQRDDIMGGSTSEFAVFMVMQIATITPATVPWALARGSNRVFAAVPFSDGVIYYDAGGFSPPNRISVSGQVPINTRHQFTFLNSVSDGIQAVRKNGSVIVSDSNGHNVTTTLLNLSSPVADGSIKGNAAEFLFFKASMSNNECLLIERNQGNYYGIIIN